MQQEDPWSALRCHCPGCAGCTLGEDGRCEENRLRALRNKPPETWRCQGCAPAVRDAPPVRVAPAPARDAPVQHDVRREVQEAPVQVDVPREVEEAPGQNDVHRDVQELRDEIRYLQPVQDELRREVQELRDEIRYLQQRVIDLENIINGTWWNAGWNAGWDAAGWD